MNINVMEEWIYEDHTLTLWDAELNVEEIIAAMDATVAAAKRKPEKNSGADHSLGSRLNDQLPVVLLAPLVEYWTLSQRSKVRIPNKPGFFQELFSQLQKLSKSLMNVINTETLLFQFLRASIITFSTLLFCRVLVSPPSKALSSLAVRKNKLIKSKDNQKLVDYPQLSYCTWMCINNFIKEHLSQTIFLSQKYRFSIFFNFPLTRLRDSCSTRPPISRQYRPTKKWPQKQ